MLDVQKLTLGEIAKIEELGGLSISMFSDDETPKGKMLAAMALIQKRRTGTPTFKWADAMLLSLEEASEIVGLNDDEEDSDDEEAGDDEGDKEEADPTPAPKKTTKRKPATPENT